MFPRMQAVAVLLAFIALTRGGDVVRSPRLVVEPPSVVRYAAATGAQVPCGARGDPAPAVTWVQDDGGTLDNRPGVRRVYSNGTLELFPSSAPRAGAVTVRCRAANVHGVIVSRDVTLHPVVESSWEAVLSAETAAAGGVAALRCAGAPASALLSPALWYKADRVINADAPSPEARVLVAGDVLLIRDVRASDAGAYSCLLRHALTAQTKRSRSVMLTVTDSMAGSAPRLVSATGDITEMSGADVCVPCAASQHPQPHYTWYREAMGRLQPVEASSGGGWLWARGAALCLRARPELSGALLCKAYNLYGDATAQMRLHVLDTLTVTVAPTSVVVDTGSVVRLNCSVSDPGARTWWVHDGVPARAGGGQLVLEGATRAHRGVYQCLARKGEDSAQAAAYVTLGDSSPELQYTFIEQALRAGGAVSLRCAASGSPSPRIAWHLDQQPLDQYLARHRYSISEETSLNGDVVSVLNISSVSAADGGRYTCKAHNSLGHVSHSARLNIYGPPSIRALAPVRVVAGSNASLHCPYAGYPISSVSWWSAGSERALGVEGRVRARGGELQLWPALASDAGHYACAASAPDGTAARRDIEILVKNPPKISPFIFSSELTEGSSAQVLCGVSSGDKPFYFSWFKDGAPLPSTLQIEEKSLNDFSLLMFSDLMARHSGDYTCRVSNHAATVNYTATLSVKVAPVWVSEPLDAAMLLGAPLLLECAAKGYPLPTVTWYKKIDDGVISTQNSFNQWEEIRSEDWGERTVKARNGSLTAPAIARQHQGLYRCVADNSVGPPLNKHVNITVHEPAHFDTSNTADRNVTCVRGHSASLTCHALGDVPLTVYWTHLGTTLDLNSFRSTVSEVRTVDGLRSVLQLRAAERSDAGEYRCHAQNQYGRSELLMFLFVEEPPEAPRNVRLGGVGSRWVRLVWRVMLGQMGRGVFYSAIYTALHSLPGTDARQNTVNLTLESTGVERIDTDGHQTLSSKLDDLRPAAAYSLRIVAANHVGQSPSSDPLLFTTLEEAPTGSPQNVRVRSTALGDLHISWTAPSQDTWNGEILGYVASWRELSRFDGSTEDEEVDRRAGAMTSQGWSSVEMTVTGLRAFSRYAVLIRAYNRAGAGPPSPTIYATTADGVPEMAPSDVRCESVSARSIRVRWSPPPDIHSHALKGFDINYAALHFSHSWSGTAGPETARTGLGGEATMQGLRTAANYSITVRARADSGVGPTSSPIYCTTLEDVPGEVESIKAIAASSDSVRVSWLPPTQRGGILTHYTLYTRELGKVGGEWSQRVNAELTEAEDSSTDMSREVRGLRERTVYEFWVRAATAAGAGPPSRPVTAAPTHTVSARISSFGRVLRVSQGSRVRLRCTAVGPGPLSRRWTPLPPAHTVTDAGDLIIHKVDEYSAGNYTCAVRNGGGSDASTYAVIVRTPPQRPAPPRLVRADTNSLHLAWDPIPDSGSLLLGYSLWWSLVESSVVHSALVGGGDGSAVVRGLACGARYRLTLRAHSLAGASPHSLPLVTRTAGDKVKAAPGKELVWANSTCIRLNLLTWGGRCPVSSWSVSLRPASGGGWRNLLTDGETAQATDLRPGSWYEIKVQARSTAGETTALYRSATHTHNGERVGETVELPFEARTSIADGSAEVDSSEWQSGFAPALLGGGLAALLVTLALMVLIRRKAATSCVKRDCSLPQVCDPHPQLYSTEPSKRNGKALSPPDNDMHEISPYATFSMGGVGGDGCALHLHTFGRAEPMDLAAPPARPNLLRSTGYAGGGCDSDSESSGSPCAACAAELYRLPAAHLSDTLPAGVESSADDNTYSAGGGGASRGVSRGARAPPRGRRRRDHARHSSQPSVSLVFVNYLTDGCEECLAWSLRRRPRGGARAPRETPLLAPPPPALYVLSSALDSTPAGYAGGGCDSDSESSGSPCAACAAELYRLPAAHLSDTLPAGVESSADDNTYSAGGGGASRGVSRGARAPPRGRRRRDHARHSSQPSVRYFSSSSLLPRQQLL